MQNSRKAWLQKDVALKQSIIFRGIKLFNFCKENDMESSFNTFVMFVNAADTSFHVLFDRDGFIDGIRDAEITDYERITTYLDTIGF
jgi:hypothetical protein